MALVGLDYWKESLGISASNTAQDARLQIYLDQSSRAFCQEVGRDIVQTTYPSAPEFGVGDSGYYSGNGTRYLRLRQYPAIATSIAVYVDNSGRFGANPDGAFAASTLLVYGTDYVLQFDGCLPGTSTLCSSRGILERVGGYWSNRSAYVPGQISGQSIDGMGNIKVAYTAGFPTVPHDVRLAICSIAAYVRRNADKGGAITSESLGGYSYSLASAAAGGAFPELGSARATVVKYREVAI